MMIGFELLNLLVNQVTPKLISLNPFDFGFMQLLLRLVEVMLV